ncbi:uncharacterized protein EAE97_002846 [Botrytis byssoidea]|uniref:BTB domain-containing protein n=1 Tax=Botrytis byssoidea TaxID=139641 RepID=A0A9P5LWV4_9HELO|nr:uncharacterized protein EAE97_002846 [Botrytis byssoidea]KAF7949337.1 hypothetical protein EAE97_002846 [Botrytis byssoidea]
MPASFQDILNSRLFKFTVGEKVDGHATEFFVHEEAIVQLSRPLEALMRGGMSESQAGCTIWDDVSKETFERFVQFAYTGDYTVPVPTYEAKRRRDRSDSLEEFLRKLSIKDMKKLKEKSSGGQGVIEPLIEPPLPGVTPEPAEPALAPPLPYQPLGSESYLVSRIFKYPELTSHLRESDFNQLVFPLLALRNNYDLTCEPREWHNPCQGYSNVLISHAALYILGDFRLIDSLKALALYKLHKTLSVFQLSTDNLQDVIDLVRYIYAEEGGEERSDGEIGALRGLVCLYMAINASALSLDDRGLEFLGEGGQFVKDFFRFEVQR